MCIRDSTYTDGTLLINLGKDVNGKVNAVTASRSLKELYTNYDKVYENLVTTVGGTMEFALADDVQKDAAPEERKVVKVDKDGTVTVSNDYDGKPIKVTLEGKCGKEKIFAITIPVVIPANEMCIRDRFLVAQLFPFALCFGDILFGELRDAVEFIPEQVELFVDGFLFLLVAVGNSHPLVVFGDTDMQGGIVGVGDDFYNSQRGKLVYEPEGFSDRPVELSLIHIYTDCADH